MLIGACLLAIYQHAGGSKPCRSFRPSPHSQAVAQRFPNFEQVQEFLDAAFENGQIQQKANSKALMDYGPLDEVLKTRRPK